MILGPKGPFCNIPPAIETQVDFIIELIGRAETIKKRHGSSRPVEATQVAEDEWLATCEDVVDKTIFKKTQSWIFGNNVEGKKTGSRFYFGGHKAYRDCLEDVRKAGYRGFKPLAEN
jgi:hypothetical protein